MPRPMFTDVDTSAEKETGVVELLGDGWIPVARLDRQKAMILRDMLNNDIEFLGEPCTPKSK